MKKDIILLGLMLTIWLLALVGIILNKEMNMPGNLDGKLYFDDIGTIDGMSNIDLALLGLTGSPSSELGGYDVTKYTGTNKFSDYDNIKDWTGSQIDQAYTNEDDDTNLNWLGSFLYGGSRFDDLNASAGIRAWAKDNPNSKLTPEEYKNLVDLANYAGSLRKSSWSYGDNLTDSKAFKSLLQDIFQPENQKILAEKYGRTYPDGTRRFGVRELLEYMMSKEYTNGGTILGYKNGSLNDLYTSLMYPIQNKLASTREKQGNLLKAEEDSRKKEEEARKNTWKYNTPEGAGWRLRDASEKIGETRSIQNVYRSRLKRGLNVDDDIELFGTTLLNAPINKKVNASESWSPRMMELSRNIDKLKNQEGEESKKELEKAKDELRELMKRKGGFIINF